MTAQEDPEDSWFVKLWIESFDGSDNFPPHSVYQPVTSPIHQTGKTTFSLREYEQIIQITKGWKANPQNIAFDIDTFMDRRSIIHKYEMQVLDEPQRAASSRTWQHEDQNLLAEDLMASNRYIKPALFPTPLNAMIDNRIFDIATSQVVIPRKTHAEVYYLDRSQLDRKNAKVRTPKLGLLTFDKPSAELWAEYTRMFDDYYQKRNKQSRERVHAIQVEGDQSVSPLTVDQIVSMIMENPKDYESTKFEGAISPAEVKRKLRVPYNRAQEAAKDATDQIKAHSAMLEAEKAV